MQHFSEITNYPVLIPPLIQNRRSFAGFWSRSVYCPSLASSSARPAGRSPRLQNRLRIEDERNAASADMSEGVMEDDQVAFIHVGAEVSTDTWADCT